MRICHDRNVVVRVGRIELPSRAWKACILATVLHPRVGTRAIITDTNGILVRCRYCALEFVHDGNLGTETVESLGQVFVTALDSVDVAQDTSTLGGKHADEQQAGWS
jgi:hypothetical protein